MRTRTEALFGAELVESLDFDPGRTVFVTMELPWKLVTPRLRSLPLHVEFVRSMERTSRSAGEISPVTDKGIRTLVELLEAENHLCKSIGSSRPEEGSEHFFAYNVELRTGRQFIHGEIVSLGTLLMSRLQENQPEWVMELLGDLGVLYRPAEIGLQAEELRDALATLDEFCRQEGLPSTIIGEALGAPSAIDALIADL